MAEKWDVPVGRDRVEEGRVLFIVLSVYTGYVVGRETGCICGGGTVCRCILDIKWSVLVGMVLSC